MGASHRITVSPKQSLGQNFLVDDNIARNIVRDLHLTPDDVVLEIGPGQGALTSHLAGRVHHLIAMEIDGRVIDALNKKFMSFPVSIVHQDFLNASLPDISQQYRRRLRIVGNIPYHLTAAILFKVFEEYDAVEDVTIMVPREVARRIVASPGTKEYGIVSVFSQFYGTPRLLFTVSPNCFYPKPKVTSAVIRIALFERPSGTVDLDLFRTVVRAAFGKRRKTLRNSLKFLPFDEDTVTRILSDIILPLNVRAEELNIEQWVRLTNEVDRCRRIVH